MQFEGSLGKLTVSSVNNPRKMIDAVVTSRSEDDVSISRIVCLRMSDLSLVLLGSLEWDQAWWNYLYCHLELLTWHVIAFWFSIDRL